MPTYPSTLAALRPVQERLVVTRGPWPGAGDLVRRLATVPTHDMVNPDDESAIVAVLSGTARMRSARSYGRIEEVAPASASS